MACVNRLRWRMARVVRSWPERPQCGFRPTGNSTSPITSVATKQPEDRSPPSACGGWRSGWPPGGSGCGSCGAVGGVRGKSALYTGFGRAPGQEARATALLLHSVRPARVCGRGSPSCCSSRCPPCPPSPPAAALACTSTSSAGPAPPAGLVCLWPTLSALSDCGRWLSGLAPAHRVCAGHHPHAQRRLLRERRGRPRL